MRLVSAFIRSGSELQIWGPKVLKLLSPCLAVLLTITYIIIWYVLGYSESWNTSNPSVLRRFTSIVNLPDLS